MEAYRISSKLREQDREYLIQTVNDVSLGTVTTTVFVDGVQTDTVNRPHPTEMDAQEVLSLVKETHGERRKEMESLLRAYQHVVNQGDSGLIYSLGVGFFSRRFFLEAAELF